MAQLQAGSLILTSDPPDPSQLEQAARALGIETRYWDIWHREHRASREALTSILGSLGVDSSSGISLVEGLEKRARQVWRTPLPPTVRITAGQNGQHIAVS